MHIREEQAMPSTVTGIMVVIAYSCIGFFNFLQDCYALSGCSSFSY
jgi:hypothetical protein